MPHPCIFYPWSLEWLKQTFSWSDYLSGFFLICHCSIISFSLFSFRKPTQSQYLEKFQMYSCIYAKTLDLRSYMLLVCAKALSINQFIYIYGLSSCTRMLGSRVRIPLEALVSVYVYNLFVTLWVKGDLVIDWYMVKLIVLTECSMAELRTVLQLNYQNELSLSF